MMSRDEALVEARRRWGPRGWASYAERRGPCLVGGVNDNGTTQIYGSGRSFELAF